MPDLAPALTRARGVIDGLVAAIPSALVALTVFAVALLLSALVKRIVARLTETRLHSHRNAGLAVGRLAQGVVLFIGLLVALSVALPPPARADALDARDRVLTAIKRDLIAEGIDLPFPTQQILFHDQTEETDGDRTRQREGWPAGTAPSPESRKFSDAVRSLGGEPVSPRGTDT